MEPDKVNLTKKYGRATIAKHDVFATSPSSTDFLRAYAFNENKSIKQKNHSGNVRIWVCESELCSWRVSLSKKRPTKGENTKLAFCPTNAWFVSSLNLVHSPSCDSARKCSSKILVELPGFKGSIVKGLSSARARVASSVKQVDNVNVDKRSAMIYRAISRAKKMMQTEEDKYDKLPSFLRAFARGNPGSTVCCQLDSQGRFFRSFVALGALVEGQDNWVPILECDGTHMKSPLYNGVCLLLVGKDGEWENIPVAVAFVHKETANNFEWFFANCVVAGIKLHDRPLFTDRGKQRDAQVRLRQRGIHINLKFCALHIFFNVCRHFRTVEPNIESVKGMLFGLQATTTLVEYEEVLAEISKRFPSSRTINVNGVSQQQTVADYLATIHPTSWTKFGNSELTPEEMAAIQSRWGTTESFGSSCPLFAGRTTSAVEGQNNALLLAGIRDSQVFGAIVLYCNLVVETLAEKKDRAQAWIDEDHTVTPRAKAMFDKQVWGVSACTVRKNSTVVFHVDDAVVSLEEEDHNVASCRLSNNENRTFTVDLSTGVCTRCPDRQQLQLPCRHIVAALFNQSGADTTTSGAYKYFHASYTATAYAASFLHVTIQLPFIPALISDPMINPPPLYNQAGGSSRVAKRDIASREKRIRSRGEPIGMRPQRHSRKKPNLSTERMELAASMNAFFNTEIRAKTKQKRKNYTCSNCGKAEGHNAAKCPNRSSGIVDDDVQPGVYIVGVCPFHLLQRRNDFVPTEIQNPTIVKEFNF